MKALIYAGMAIGDIASEADCETKPEVTLTFESARDLARFEMTVKANTAAIDAISIMLTNERPRDTWEFAGIRFKLAVRQSHETASVDNRPQPKFRRF